VGGWVKGTWCLPSRVAIGASILGWLGGAWANTTRKDKRQGEGEGRMKVGDSRRALVAATTKGGGRLLTWTWGGVG